MLRSNLFLGLLCVACCLACNSTKNRPLDINFSKDSSSIAIKNIDPVGLLKIKNGHFNDAAVQQMVRVLVLPGDKDTTEVEQLLPGKITVDSSVLRFHPLKPFEKGKHYLVETYINSEFGDLQSVIKSQAKINMAPNQKTLLR